MSEQDYRPVWIHKLDAEMAGYERERDKHLGMAEEYDKKIGELKEKRREWSDPQASGEG